MFKNLVVIFFVLMLAAPAFAKNGNGNQPPRPDHHNTQGAQDPCVAQGNCGNGDHGQGRPPCNSNPNSWHGEPDACTETPEEPSGEEPGEEPEVPGENPEQPGKEPTNNPPASNGGGSSTDNGNIDVTPTEAPAIEPRPVTHSYTGCIEGGAAWQQWGDEGQFEIWAAEEENDEFQEPFLVTGSFKHSAKDPSLSPNGCLVAVIAEVEGQTDIYVMDLSGRNLRQITDTPEVERDLEWEDDWFIYFTNDEQVHRVTQWGREREDLVEGTNGIAIGDLLAFSDSYGIIRIKSMTDGRYAVHAIGAGTAVTFSYDGTELYWADRQGTIHIYDVVTMENYAMTYADGQLTLDPDNTGYIVQADLRIWEAESYTDMVMSAFYIPAYRQINTGEGLVTVALNPVQMNPDWKNGISQAISPATTELWFNSER